MAAIGMIASIETAVSRDVFSRLMPALELLADSPLAVGPLAVGAPVEPAG